MRPFTVALPWDQKSSVNTRITIVFKERPLLVFQHENYSCSKSKPNLEVLPGTSGSTDQRLKGTYYTCRHLTPEAKLQFIVACGYNRKRVHSLLPLL